MNNEVVKPVQSVTAAVDALEEIVSNLEESKDGYYYTYKQNNNHDDYIRFKTTVDHLKMVMSIEEKYGLVEKETPDYDLEP